MKPQYNLDLEDKGIDMVTIPLAEYEELRKILTIVKLEKELTKMFDSDNRVARALLEEIRKLNLKSI